MVGQRRVLCMVALSFSLALLIGCGRLSVRKSKPADAQEEAARQMAALLPTLRVVFDPVFATPVHIYRERGFLTPSPATELEPEIQTAAPRALAGEATNDVQLVRAFLDDNRALFGHGSSVLDTARIVKDYTTEHNGLRTVVWQQEVGGIPVSGAFLTAHITRWGELASLSSKILPNPAAAAEEGTPGWRQLLESPKIAAGEAVARAFEAAGKIPVAQQFLSSQPDPVRRKITFKSPAGEEPVEAELKWLPLGRNRFRLAWDVRFAAGPAGEAPELFSHYTDAATGKTIRQETLTRRAASRQYRVFPSDSPSAFSPGHHFPSLRQPVVPGVPPVYSRVLVKSNALSATASPEGWVPEGNTRTSGNNVDAYDARGGLPPDPESRRPQGTNDENGILTFDSPLNLAEEPTTTNNMNAAIINAFYWCNWMHDRLYQLGFTEAAGNFQNDNFGRGGIGGDALNCAVGEAGYALASIWPDGQRSTIHLGLAPVPGTAPDRATALDVEVILHEYTHGLIWRTIPGWAEAAVSDAVQTWFLDEGWCDFMALCLLSNPSDALDGNYAYGGYSSYLRGGQSTNYYFGYRYYPYSTDTNNNPLTFANIGGTRDPYNAPRNSAVRFGDVYTKAQVWGVTLWDMRRKLIEKHGFDRGNELVLQLVVDGIRMTPARPTFLQARDAILLADMVNTRGGNQGELWAAFAKRGMGWRASVPNDDAARDDVTESFEVPPAPDQKWVYSSGMSIISSPAVGPDGTIYFGSMDQQVHALYPDGSLKWKFPSAPTGWSFHATPAVGPDGTVYIGGYDGKMYALNPEGTLKWSEGGFGQIFSSVAIGENGWIYFGSLISGKMFAYDGPVKRWERLLSNTIYSSAAIGRDGTVYVGTLDGMFYALDPATGADRPGWPVRAGTGFFSSPAIGEDGTIYVGSYNGKLYAFRPGGERMWEVSMGGAVRSSPAAGSDGTIYVGSDSGSVFAINPDGTIKWQTSTGRSVRSSPAITGDGAVLVGNDDGRLIWLETESGTIGRQFATRSAYSIFSSPAIASDGTIYFGNSFGQLTALSNPGGFAEAPWPMFRQNMRRQGRLPAGVQAGRPPEVDRLVSTKGFEDAIEAHRP